ncbi:MAG: dephospho-CoA kinase, partial [Kiritimatiellaeota bacterium]|nr:dephospho-CoA kinase [Kiritimatiellota bacterium]
GGDCSVGVESTVLDMTSDPICILRLGGVSKAELERVSGVEISVSVHAGADGKPRSPGQKYRHYAPRTPLTVLHILEDGSIGRIPDAALAVCPEEYADIFDSPIIYGRMSEPESLARGLYAALREADARNPAAIAAVCPFGGVYDAVRDRLVRAEEKHPPSADGNQNTRACGRALFSKEGRDFKPHMKIIGLTGPSGAGKSCVLEHLKTKGLRVICADEVYRGLLETREPMRERILECFGTLDTKAIGKTVFGDEAALRKLESITHPYVIEAITPMLKGDAVIEAVALYDSGVAELCGAVIYLTADRETLISRIVSRDGVTREYAGARLDSRVFSVRNGDYVIENNGDLASLYANIDAIYEKIIRR